MYPEIRAIMARKRLTYAELIERSGIDCNVGTLSNKLNGKSPITFNEAIAIKNALHSELRLEDLFKQEDQED